MAAIDYWALTCIPAMFCRENTDFTHFVATAPGWLNVGDVWWWES